MRLEEMKNNIPETPDFIHKMVQEEVSRQLQDTKVVPMKKRKWNKVQAAAAAARRIRPVRNIPFIFVGIVFLYG